MVRVSFSVAVATRLWGVTRLFVLLLLTLAMVEPAVAEVVCRPIEPERIDGMWRQYSSLPGVQPNSDNDEYECIAVPSAMKLICRTKTANPAHPSIVIRTVAQDNGKIAIATEADTAADCGAFLEMMQQFSVLNQQMRDELQ